MRKLTTWTWLFGLGLLFLVSGGRAASAVPPTVSSMGGSVKIVFTYPIPPLSGALTDTNIWIMDADGSNRTQLTTVSTMERAPAISPDGSKIIYQSYDGSNWTLWVMNIDGSGQTQLPITGTPSGGPMWSPDGTQIAYSNSTVSFWEIWLANADGSNPQRLTNNPGAAGHPTWSPDGQKIAYGSDPSANVLDLYTINSNGLSQTLLVSASGSGFSNHIPAWSPDGTQIATVHWPAGSGTGPYDLWLMNANGTGGQVLVQNIDHPHQQNLSWSADGQWLVFGKGGQIWRVDRDGQNPTQITTAGGAEPDIGGVNVDSGYKIAFTYPPPPVSGPPIDTNIWIMEADGANRTQLTTAPTMERAPAISPDGTKIMYQSYISNTWTLWVMNLNGSNPTQISIIGNPSGGPEWSPDGTKIVYSNDVVSFWELWVANANGTNFYRLTDNVGEAGSPSWSPDGQTIVYQSEPTANYFDLYTVNSNGLSQTLFVSASDTGYSNHMPTWSPDGTQIATIRWPAGTTGPYDLWVMNADGTGGQVLVQNVDSPNQQQLTWSGDSEWILFSQNHQIWRIKRNGEFLTHITTEGGVEPDTNVPNFPPSGYKIVFTAPIPPVSGPPIDTNIWIMEADGSQLTQLITATTMERAPAISPDGSKIIYQSYISGTWTLWKMNIDGTGKTQIPITGTPAGGPEWSRDSTQIAYSNDLISFWEIWVTNIHGTNPHRLTDNVDEVGHPSWSPDGQKVVYSSSPATNYSDLYLINSNGTGQMLLANSSAGYSHQVPAWSPDGLQIATLRWASGSAGPYDLWVMNADGNGGRVLVQNLDSLNQQEIAWSTDSLWILFGKAGQVWRVRRDGHGLKQMTLAGGAEPSTNVASFPSPNLVFFNPIHKIP